MERGNKLRPRRTCLVKWPKLAQDVVFAIVGCDGHTQASEAVDAALMSGAVIRQHSSIKSLAASFGRKMSINPINQCLSDEYIIDDTTTI